MNSLIFVIIEKYISAEETLKIAKAIMLSQDIREASYHKILNYNNLHNIYNSLIKNLIML